MKKIFTSVSILFSLLALQAFAQNNISPAVVDSLAREAMRLGIQPVDIPGYIRLHSGSSSANLNAERNAAPVFSTQNIVNPGFETGDFTGWTGAIGDNNLNSLGPLQNIQQGIYTGAVNPLVTSTTDRHSIMTAAADTDLYSGEYIVPPGYGTYVARLGNTYANYQGEYIEQYWNVTAAELYLKLNYMVVLNDGGHLPGESPYFYYIVTDSTETDTIAFRRDELAGVPSGGYQTSTLDAFTYYLPWQNDSVSLSAYIGQTVKIRFLVSGCIYGGHFGYCYVDVSDPASLTGISGTQAHAFEMYPNPADGNISLVFPAEQDQRNIRITDLAGRLILESSGNTAQNMQIDLSEQPAGLYFVTVTGSNGTSVQRLVIR